MISKCNVKCTDSNVKFAESEVRMASIINKIRMACNIKQLLDSVFVISGIIKVSVSVIGCRISQKPHPIIVYNWPAGLWLAYLLKESNGKEFFDFIFAYLFIIYLSVAKRAKNQT